MKYKRPIESISEIGMPTFKLVRLDFHNAGSVIVSYVGDECLGYLSMGHCSSSIHTFW